MNDTPHWDWDIQRLAVSFQNKPQEQMREEVLRPLARLVARRLERDGLAKGVKAGQTIAVERREVAA